MSWARGGLRGPAALVALGLVAASIAVGCGSERAQTTPSRDLSPTVDYSEHPYALTCGHVLAIDSVKARQFHKAAFALAGDVRVPGTHRNIVWGRFVYALLDLCQRSARPDYRPAADAVRLVSEGRYVVTGAPTADEVRRLGSGRQRRSADPNARDE
jgi:hypothetical protein